MNINYGPDLEKIKIAKARLSSGWHTKTTLTELNVRHLLLDNHGEIDVGGKIRRITSVSIGCGVYLLSTEALSGEQATHGIPRNPPR